MSPRTRMFFKDDDFQFGVEIALGSVYRGYADAGEVLATVARIKNGDADQWVREWTSAADTLRAVALDDDAAGRLVSARALHRRAATYYATALEAITRAGELDRRDDIWTAHRACWERVVDLLPVPGERLEIPYESTTLPGYFFRAPDARPGEPRPLVVLNNGSDGATSQMALSGGDAAHERGYHWMTFDGPGQQAALFERGIPFRSDWEAVLTPVIDAMVARPDIDPARIAVIGISQGGYRLGDEVADITTPLLITDPEDEQFWPGQSQQLYDRLPGAKELVSFTAQEGANRHCEPMGAALRDTRVFNWLDTYLGPAAT
jgi:hypothetical protein